MPVQRACRDPAALTTPPGADRDLRPNPTPYRRRLPCLRMDPRRNHPGARALRHQKPLRQAQKDIWLRPLRKNWKRILNRKKYPPHTGTTERLLGEVTVRSCRYGANAGVREKLAQAAHLGLRAGASFISPTAASRLRRNASNRDLNRPPRCGRLPPPTSAPVHALPPPRHVHAPAGTAVANPAARSSTTQRPRPGRLPARHAPWPPPESMSRPVISPTYRHDRTVTRRERRGGLGPTFL